MGERHRGHRTPGGASAIRAGMPLRLAFGLSLLGAGFLAGRYSAPSDADGSSVDVAELTPFAGYLVQDSGQPLDPRELIPLPDRRPGSGGPQAPSGDGECPLYFFHDGQFYQLEPGAPGQQAEPGQPGRFGGIPELFPLEPLPGAPAPPPRQPPAPPSFGLPGIAELPGLPGTAELPGPGPLLPISFEGTP
jgi:hypothetical protein